jgi:SAM-dependent methyltransferase
VSDQPLTAEERTLPEHLGGHFGNTNMDGLTFGYLAGTFRIRSMVDVGCGPGGMIDLARQYGIEAYGVDGDPYMAREGIYTHDYTTGPLPAEDFDLVWCTEFVEHVEAQYQDNYLATFDGGKVLFLTAAPPGFPGHHHVNCQSESYWIDLLATRGWQLDREATQWVRTNGGHVFSQRQGLVFVRSSSPL